MWTINLFEEKQQYIPNTQCLECEEISFWVNKQVGEGFWINNSYLWETSNGRDLKLMRNLVLVHILSNSYLFLSDAAMLP